VVKSTGLKVEFAINSDRQVEIKNVSNNYAYLQKKRQMSLPRIAHFTTSLPVLPEDEQRVINQFKKIHPQWDVKIWRDQDKDDLFRRHLGDQYQLVSNLPYGVMKADIARYLFLKEEGGWYIDTDYQVLKSLDEFSYHSLVLPVSWNKDDPSNSYPGLDKVCNSIMASEPGHPFWDQVVFESLLRIKKERVTVNRIEEMTGPDMLTQVLAIHPEKANEVFMPEQKYFHPRIKAYPVTSSEYPVAYGVHWCKGSWRNATLFGKVVRRLNRVLKARRIKKWIDENIT
jgi:mannosyltransferase OCH1-like enzyme